MSNPESENFGEVTG